jgi:hypothetical protein
VSTSDPEQDGGTDAEHPSTPKPDPLDVDSAFAAIIAGWADSPSTGSWPTEEDLTVGRHRLTGDGPDDEVQYELLTPTGNPLVPALDLPVEEDEPEPDAFVPPEPPPLPRGDLVGWMAWIGVIAGPLFLLVVVIGWRGAPQLLVVAALLAFVGGFITLVSRMPKNRDDDDYSDGAVV